MSLDNLKINQRNYYRLPIQYFEIRNILETSTHILVKITGNAIDVDLLVIDSVRVAQTYVGKPHLSSQEHNHVHFRA